MNIDETTTTLNLRKYQSRNPLVQYLIGHFLKTLVEEIKKIAPASVIDLGCGEGIVADFLCKEITGIVYQGFDRSFLAIEHARQRNLKAEFQALDLFNLQLNAGSSGLILCLEVMEHLPDTDVLCRKIRSLHAGHVIFSVPWEPFFRIGNFCRGQYLTRWGNHPDHLQSFNPASLQRTLERHFCEVKIRRSFPWIFAICRNYPVSS